MIPRPLHIIGQSIIDLLIHSTDYRDVQDEAADLFKSKLSHSVNRLFDEACGGSDNTFTVESLRVDLGTINRQQFSKEFEKRLLEQLRRSLNRMNDAVPKEVVSSNRKDGVSIRAGKDSQFDRLTHFLVKGFFPWQSSLRNGPSPELLFTNAITTESLKLRQFLFGHGSDEGMIKRIVFQFSEKLVYSLIEILEPAEAAFIIAYLEKLKGGQRRKQFVKKEAQHFEKVRLRVTLSYLLDRRESYFNRKEFVRSTLHGLSQHYNVSYEEVLNWFKSVLDEDKQLRESKSELAVIIRDIAEEERNKPAIVEEAAPAASDAGLLPFFERVVFTTGSSVVILLRDDTETRLFTRNYAPIFHELVEKYLANRKDISIATKNITLLYDNSSFIPGIAFKDRVSVAQLSIIARQFIERGYIASKPAWGKREHLRHLLTIWLTHYPKAFKELLLQLVPVMDHESRNGKHAVRLYRALLLFFGERAKDMMQLVIELLALPLRYPVCNHPSYYRQFVIIRALHFPDRYADHVAYGKYMITAVAHEFRLSEDQLDAWLKNNRYSGGTNTTTPLHTPFFITPVTAISNWMADKTKAGKIATNLHSTAPLTPLFAHSMRGNDGLPEGKDHLPAIEFYLLYYSLPWWYSYDISMLREQMEQLAAGKDKQLLALLLKHRANSVFVSNLIREFAMYGGEQILPAALGLEPAPILRFYKTFYAFLKGLHIPEQNSSYRFFEALVAVIIEAKSFDIRRTDFLARLFRPLVNEKTGSRTRVEKLLLQLMLFTGLNKSLSPSDFDNRDSFRRLLSMFFHQEYDLPDETLAMMLAGQISSLIMNQYSSRLVEPFDDTIRILLEIQKAHPWHAAWIERLSASIDSRMPVTTLLKQLSTSDNVRRAAWLLRGLLRRKRASFLQYTHLSTGDMTSAVAILLMQDDTGFSFVKDAEMVFTSTTGSASLQASLFWPLVLDYTIRRSAFNQKNLLYTVLTGFSQAGRLSFYQLVADAISFLQSAAYTGNRQPLLQLLFEMADDKKIAELLNKTEPLIKPVVAKTVSKKVVQMTTKKTNTERKAVKPLLEEGESVYINNAGLVLINPFIKRLFDMLSYTENNAFKTDELRTRGIHLLQFVAGGFENVGEQYLFFNKILCGIDPLEPLEATLELTTEEKDAAESLLRNVINSWPAMKNASLDGLRGSYLVRDGRLKMSEQGWRLVVEKKPYDLLLNQLPWGFTTVKLPWMPKPIFVQWI